MGGCYVYGCKNNTDLKIKGLTFHRFPSDPNKKKQWIKIMKVKEGHYPGAHARICSIHFQPHFLIKRKMKVVISSDAIPTIFPSYPKNMQPKFINQSAPKICSTTNSKLHSESSDENAQKEEKRLPKFSPTAKLIIARKNYKINILQKTLKRAHKKVNSLSSILKCLLSSEEVISLLS